MEKEQLHLCPHCGNKTILKLIEEFEIEEDVYDENNEYQTFVYNYYYIFRCITCNRVSIYGHFYTYPENQRIDSLDCLFPIVRNISCNFPHYIQKTYNDAKRIKKISSNSFILLLRKALEQICSDQNAVGKSLSEKINDLIKRNILPGKIGDLASMIRIIGNISAHGNEYLDLNDADYIGEFFNIIAEYIYSIDSKINSLKCKWELNDSRNNT
jgi:hypothetical protein